MAGVLLDPNRLAHDGTVALTAAEVSPDGRLLAAALAEAGSDWQTIRVYDVASGAATDDVLRWAKWVAPTWLADGTGFLYWRYPAPDGQEFTDAMGAGELVLHRLGTAQDSDTLVWSRPADRDWMVDPYVSPDGRWLVLDGGSGNRLAIDRRGPPDRRRPRRCADRGPTHRCWSETWSTRTAWSRWTGTRCSCAPSAEPNGAGWWPSI